MLSGGGRGVDWYSRIICTLVALYSISALSIALPYVVVIAATSTLTRTTVAMSR